MSSQQSSSSSVSSSTSSKYTCGEVSSTNPLWAYVTMLQNKKEGEGNASWRCNYCNIIYKGSYFRVKSHLLKEKGHGIAICSQVSNDCLEEMKKIEREAMEKSKPVHVPLPTGTTSFNPSLDGGKRRRVETPIGRAFNNEARDHLSCEITSIADDAFFIKNFIMNHSMRLAMFNQFVHLKLLAVAETRFASIIIMLKRMRTIKHVDYVLNFTSPIYDMLRSCDTDEPSLHLVYEKWDSMIEKVKLAIYQHEGKELNEHSSFYEVDRIEVTREFVKFSSAAEELGQFDSLQDRGNLKPKEWWIMYDEWDPSEGVGVLEVASLSLDEPDLEAVLFNDDGDGNDEIDTVRV
ncbi:Zinc finger, BED-type [Sesbania bispinosa]|nr:Zinc finger, BED-type [Sesbania bispinosa]